MSQVTLMFILSQAVSGLCFHANIVQNNSVLYPLEASHNIRESVKPF
jgi:hypothetical protein